MHNTCSACYEVPIFERSKQWKHNVMLPWLQTTEPCPLVSDQIVHEIVSLRDAVDLELDKAYVDARIREMYDIITEYPDSGCAVLELRDALARTQRHRWFARSVREILKRRILHPGASTSQIIDVYISTVKVFRILDPTAMLFDATTRPVRIYLQKRKDTVRCIVASLTDESSGELYEELQDTDAPPLESCGEIDDDEYGNSGHYSTSLENQIQGNEVLPMLISIYGSKDVFVNEYRLILANKCTHVIQFKFIF